MGESFDSEIKFQMNSGNFAVEKTRRKQLRLMNCSLSVKLKRIREAIRNFDRLKFLIKRILRLKQNFIGVLMHLQGSKQKTM